MIEKRTKILQTKLLWAKACKNKNQEDKSLRETGQYAYFLLVRNNSVASGFSADFCMQNGGLGGNKKSLVQFYRSGEENACERHCSRVSIDKEQNNIVERKKHLKI